MCVDLDLLIMSEYMNSVVLLLDQTRQPRTFLLPLFPFFGQLNDLLILPIHLSLYMLAL